MNRMPPIQQKPYIAKTNYQTNTNAKLPTKHPPNQAYPQPVIRPSPRPPDPPEPIQNVCAGIEPKP